MTDAYGFIFCLNMLFWLLIGKKTIVQSRKKVYIASNKAEQNQSAIQAQKRGKKTLVIFLNETIKMFGCVIPI
jgi:hypothetical protein